jgi:sugar phosphate isomerase/epimerase
MLTRRSLLAAVAFAPLAAAAETKSQLGAAPTGFTARGAAARKAGKPLNMVEYCHSLGLSGVETTLPNADTATVLAMRTQVETYQMRVVLNTPLPKGPGDLSKFDASVKACKDCGAIAIHAAMTQRRYEQFDTFDQFRANFQQCQKSVELAEPILAKYRMKLAIENHKGWRSVEQAAWMKRLASEWVGVCFDFGNNLALCETPDQTLKNLLPYTVFCHIKDMAVESYKDGFLLSEVPFGDGLSNLKGMVQTLRERDPNMLFCLETITREPLKIPVFTDKYWLTFEDSVSPLPARDLAKTLELVRDNPPKKPLPRTAGLSPDEQIKLEDDNNRKCIEYGRQNLGF